MPKPGQHGGTHTTRSARSQYVRLGGDVVSLIVFGVIAGLTYDGKYVGVPWWVWALFAAASLGSLTRHAWLVPGLFDDD